MNDGWPPLWFLGVSLVAIVVLILVLIVFMASTGAHLDTSGGKFGIRYYEEEAPKTFSQKLGKLEEKVDTLQQNQNKVVNPEEGESQTFSQKLSQLEKEVDTLQQNQKNFVKEVDELNRRLEMLNKKLEPSGKTVTVSLSSVELFSEPNETSEVISVEKKDARLEVLEEFSGERDIWYKVKSPGNKEGWVLKKWFR